MSSSALSKNLSNNSTDKTTWHKDKHRDIDMLMEAEREKEIMSFENPVDQDLNNMGHVGVLEDKLGDYIDKASDIKTRENEDMRQISITNEAALGYNIKEEEEESSRISAYARLDFDNFSFYVQTLQVVLGRKSNSEMSQSSTHAVDVHLSGKKAISRKHAKIFYNFGTQRFELSVLGRNGAFVDNTFIEKGITVPLIDRTKIQIGDIPFNFVLPSTDQDSSDERSSNLSKPFNPSDAINLRINLYKSKSPTPKSDRIEPDIHEEAAQMKNAATKSAMEKDQSSSNQYEANSVKSNTSNVSQPADSDLLESQIQNILANDGDIKDSDIIGMGGMSERDIAREEDEIDKLVKQHNMEQGVDLDDDDMTNIDMDLSALDQEIAALAPLIDAHHQDLMKEKEEKRRKLEGEKKRKQDIKKMKDQNENSIHAPKSQYLTGEEPKVGTPGSHIYQDGTRIVPPPMSPQSSSTSSSLQNQARSTPLMGKPAAPRMGKPASIQPPISRLYGRQFNGLTKTQMVDNKLTTTTLTGIPTHLVGMNGMPLKLSSGIPMMKSTVPSRTPPPRLEVPIHVITRKSTTYTRHPTITVDMDVGSKWSSSFKNHESNDSKYPLPPKKRREMRKQPKKVYTLDEIPEQFRTKPSLSYTIIVTNILKSKGGENGLTISEINDSIKDIYPYFSYCPDGWQFSVSHNVKLNKIFKKVTKKEDEWTYVLDEPYINEREKIRKKQQEIAAAKAKEAAIRAEELKQKQRLEAQQAISNNIVGRNFASPYSSGIRIPQSQFISRLHQKSPPNGQKPKSIAELASEIRRDGVVGSKAPLYFKPQSILQMNSSGELVKRNDIPASVSGTPSLPVNIKAQLAANRSNSTLASQSASGSPSSKPSSQPQSAVSSPGPGSPPQASMNQDTKKSLAYLQKELFTLYKNRNLSYNTATTTEIITKALATTIAQVNVIGAKAGCKDNALGFLVEKAPQQVSKILDIALSKSIKEKQGLLSNPSTRATTPTAPNYPTDKGSSIQASPSPHVLPQSSSQIAKSRSPSFANGLSPPSGNSAEPKASDTVITKIADVSSAHHPVSSGSSVASVPEQFSTSASPVPLPKPPSFNQGKSASPRSDSFHLAKPPTFTSTIPRPPGFAKSSGLSKPPQFLSNKVKPTGPEKESQNSEATSQSPSIGEKRELETSNSAEGIPSKVFKLE